jgi:hypothetical protein
MIEEHVSIRGRKYSISEGQKEIAKCEDWSLHSVSVSPCGRYRNLKLYYLRKKAKKRVWYLNVHTEKDRLIFNRESETLNKYYGGMSEWVMNALQGIILPIPKFKKVEKDDEIKIYVFPDGMKDALSRVLDAAWDDGKPLSIHPQTKARGRYAPKVIGDAWKMTHQSIKQMLIDMIQRGEIITDIFDRNTKVRGLKSVEGTSK